MKTSEQINEIAGALAKAQADITAAKKDRTNPHFGAKYATLDSLWESIRKPLTTNGLAVLQGVSTEPDGEDNVKVTITTKLIHTSGQWAESAITLYPKDAGPQAIGSVITYGRRYGLGAVVGGTPDEDDDANAGQKDNGRKMPGHYHQKLPPTEAPKTEQEKQEYEERAWSAPPEKAPQKPAQARTAAIQQGVLGKEYFTERDRLLSTADSLGEELSLSPQQVSEFWMTYCGGATRKNVALDALRELVSYLNLRLDQRRTA